MKVRKLKGGYTSPTGRLYEFVEAECECCNVQGMLTESLKRTDTHMGVKKVYDIRPPTIYYKVDEEGLQYDAMCGFCIEELDDTDTKEALSQS